MPQGSCLGPWLYLAYAGALFDVIPPSISVYGFADDYIAHTTFKPTTQDSETKAMKDIENSAITINDWINRNKLKMNTSKTEFILFGSKQQLNKFLTTDIDIAGDKVSRVKCIRYMGTYLNDTLTLKEHVKTKCRTAMLNFFRIKNACSYHSKEATETLVLSLVSTHLDYCNVILYGVSDKDIYKLQRIQNMCAKLVLKHQKQTYDLHWLSIKARINQKNLTFM